MLMTVADFLLAEKLRQIPWAKVRGAQLGGGCSLRWTSSAPWLAGKSRQKMGIEMGTYGKIIIINGGFMESHFINMECFLIEKIWKNHL